MMIPMLKLARNSVPLILAAVLLAAACQASLAQGDADLEAPGLESFPAPASNEPTAKLLADNGIWWSLQPLLDDEDAPPLVNPVSQKKALEVFAGTDNAYSSQGSTMPKQPLVQTFCSTRA